MNFVRMASDPPQTPYAPQWDYSFGTTIFKDIDLEVLSKTCLEKEREIKKLPVAYVNGDVNDGNTGLGKKTGKLFGKKQQEEQYYHQIFFHYVLQEGNRSECAWDRAR